MIELFRRGDVKLALEKTFGSCPIPLNTEIIPLFIIHPYKL